MFVFLMFFEDFPGLLRHSSGNSGKFRHVNAVAAVGGSWCDGSQKDNPVLRLLHRDVVVLDAGQQVRKFS